MLAFCVPSIRIIGEPDIDARAEPDRASGKSSPVARYTLSILNLSLNLSRNAMFVSYLSLPYILSPLTTELNTPWPIAPSPPIILVLVIEFFFRYSAASFEMDSFEDKTIGIPLKAAYEAADMVSRLIYSSTFGTYICQLVQGASEPSVVDQDHEISDQERIATWKIRKQHTLEYLKNETNADIKLIACADKLSNIRYMVNDYRNIGEKVWQRFNIKDKNEQEWYYRGLVTSLKSISKYNMYSELSEKVNQLFGMPEDIII